MKTNFETLSATEYEKLRQSVAWVAVLIAGADGKIDSDELSWASKIAKIRAYANPDILHDFYQDVGEDFDEYLQSIIDNSPQDSNARTTIASDKIAEIDPILAKLSPYIASRVYESLKSFAIHVAKASGGFMRMWSISHEEDKFIKLPMLTEVPEVDEPE